MKNKRVLAYMAIIFTVIVWGISFLSIKVAVDKIPTMTLSFIRFTMATIILYAIFKVVEPKTRLQRSDYPSMILSGLLGYSIYFFFENNGVRLTTASAASIIIATLPVFTVVGDALIFGFKLDMLKMAGVILSVLGVCFVVGANIFDVGGSSLGYAYMFGAVISWVAYSFVTRPLTKKYSGIAVAFYQSLFGTLALIPFIFMERTDWSTVSSSVILNIVFLGMVCSALANYLYIYAMDGLGVSLTSLFMNMVPVVTVITSFFILGESINIKQAIGGILVVLSVYLVSVERK